MRRVLPFVLVGLVAFALGWVVKSGGREKLSPLSPDRPDSEMWYEVTIQQPGRSVPDHTLPVYRVVTPTGATGEPLEPQSWSVTVWQIDPATGRRSHVNYYARP